MKSLIKRMIEQSGVEPIRGDTYTLYTEASLFRVAELVAREWAKDSLCSTQAAVEAAYLAAANTCCAEIIAYSGNEACAGWVAGKIKALSGTDALLEFGMNVAKNTANSCRSKADKSLWDIVWRVIERCTD